MNPINGLIFFSYIGGRRVLRVFGGDPNQLRFFLNFREMFFIYITMISTPEKNEIGTFLFFDLAIVLLSYLSVIPTPPKMTA